MIVKKTLALRGTPELVAVLNKWDSSRPRAVEDIVSYVSDLSDIPHEEADSKLRRAWRQHIDISDVLPEDVPSQIKIVVEIEEEKWDKAMNLFKTVFSLKQPQMPFFIRVGGVARIRDMDAEKALSKEYPGDLDIPEMAKRFAQVLMSPNSQEFYEIKRILSSWQ